MKTFLILFSTILFSAAASATSLQAAFDNQDTITVSPVEYDGMPILMNDRGKVCYSLGYKRVVSYTSEECGHKNTYLSLRVVGQSIELEPSLCNSFNQKLKSITCAGR